MQILICCKNHVKAFFQFMTIIFQVGLFYPCSCWHFLFCIGFMVWHTTLNLWKKNRNKRRLWKIFSLFVNTNLAALGTHSPTEAMHCLQNKQAGSWCCEAFFSCQNPNSTTTQLNITFSWVRHENDFAPPYRNSMSTISKLLLIWFWWHFKRRFLGTSRTDSNCHGNIYPGSICPYKEYLNCYWPDFDDTLKVASWQHLEQISTIELTFVHATFVLVTFVHIGNISTVTDPILMTL